MCICNLHDYLDITHVTIFSNNTCVYVTEYVEVDKLDAEFFSNNTCVYVTKKYTYNKVTSTDLLK